MCGSDKEGMFDTGHHFDGVTINRGDYLSMDMIVSYKGYWADMGRVINVGPASESFKKDCDVLWKIWDTGFEAVRPGIKAKEVWEAVTKVYKEAGLWSPEMTGHGIGLDIHEPPVLENNGETILEPGMTLALEMGILSGWRRLGGGGPGHVENLIIVTEKGSNAVIGLPRGIISTSFPTI
jgi:Xaa-Pro aminopeptidase